MRYDATTGAFLGVFASSSQLTGSVTLTFGLDGNLYVAGEISGNVTRFDGQTGAFIDVFASGGGLAQPNNLAFGPDGNLYVTGEGSGVRRYDGTTRWSVSRDGHRARAPRPIGPPCIGEGPLDDSTQP